MIDVSFFFGYSLFFSVSISVFLSRREINEPRGVCPAGIRSGAASESFGCNMAANLVSSGSGAVYFYFPSADGSFYFGTFFFSFLVGGEGVIVTLVGVDAFSLMYIILTRVYHDQGDAHF